MLRIYTSHDDRDHRPGDPDWEDAKWRWRTSLMTAVTVADHLGATHYLVSNLMTTATREQLVPTTRSAGSSSRSNTAPTT